MKKSLANRRIMLTTLLTFLDQNSEVWSGIPRLVTSVEKLREVVQKILKSEKEQENAKVSIGEYKAQLKLQMATQGDLLNNIVEVFAMMEGNEELALRMHDSKSSLMTLSYESLKNRIETIIDAAKENKEVLVAEYGLEETQISELETVVNEFVSVEGKPQEFRIKSGVATEEIQLHFKESREILINEIDKLMKLFQVRNPEFYMGYKRARLVID